MQNTNEFDTNKFLDTKVYPNLNRMKLLNELNPREVEDYIVMDCPKCNNPGCAFLYNNGIRIVCNHRNECKLNITLWDYIQDKDNLSNKETLEKLAESADAILPGGYTPAVYAKFEEHEQQRKLQDATMSYFREQLYTPQGKNTLNYLRNRGYSDTDIKIMGLGYNPGYEKTKKYLISKKFLPSEINEILNHLKDRNNHIVTFPYYDNHENILSIYGRSINESGAKYLNFSTVKKTIPFNFHTCSRSEELIIVEGYFDALLATAQGIKNVIASTSAQIPGGQIETIIKSKCRRIFLVPDNDDAGLSATKNSIKKLAKSGIDIFVISIPNEYKDLDEWIVKCGIEPFEQEKRNAQCCGTWLAERITQEHDCSTDVGRRETICEATKCFNVLKSPLEKQSLRNAISKTLNIPDEHWELVIESAQKQEKLEQYKKDLAEYGDKFQQLISAHKYDEATMLPVPQKSENTKKQSFSIDFISDMPINFLTEEAPPMPRLISINKGMDYSAGKITEPFIVKGIVGALIGAGGMGKTHYLTQMALAVASGCKFLNEYLVEQPGGVVCFYGENANDDIHRIIRKLYTNLSPYEQNNDIVSLIEKNLALKSVHGMDASFLDKNGLPTEIYENFYNNLKSIANRREDGLSLIIFDPVSRFLGSEAEKDNAQATRFISLLESLALDIKGNPTILFGHHMSKSGFSSGSTDQSSSRGSSAITDGVRLQINLERVTEEGNKTDRNHINQKMAKSNHTRIIDEQKLFKDQYGCLSITKENDNDEEVDSTTTVKNEESFRCQFKQTK